MDNVVRYLHFQVYKTSQKLSLDFDQIKISEADFVEAMCRMVPSTHRIQDQSQSPLVPRLRPLLTSVVGKFIFCCNNLIQVKGNRLFCQMAGSKWCLARI